MGRKLFFVTPHGHVQPLPLRSTTQNPRLSFLSLRFCARSLSVYLGVLVGIHSANVANELSSAAGPEYSRVSPVCVCIRPPD